MLKVVLSYVSSSVSRCPSDEILNHIFSLRGETLRKRNEVTGARCLFDKLPEELLSIIVSHVGMDSLKNVSLVRKAIGSRSILHERKKKRKAITKFHFLLMAGEPPLRCRGERCRHLEESVHEHLARLSRGESQGIKCHYLT
jgi:hypothetical protein